MFLGSRHSEVETWMIAGTAKQRECYPVHEITKRLSSSIIDNILGFQWFHALKGCDTTSSFTSFGKRKCWKVYEETPHLHVRHSLGRNAKRVVCRLYRHQVHRPVLINADLICLKRVIKTLKTSFN